MPSDSNKDTTNFNRNQFSLKVSDANQIIKLGDAAEYGQCKGNQKDGTRCTNAVNISVGHHCQFHMGAVYKKLVGNRPEINSTPTFARSSSLPLPNACLNFSSGGNSSSGSSESLSRVSSESHVRNGQVVSAEAGRDLRKVNFPLYFTLCSFII